MSIATNALFAHLRRAINLHYEDTRERSQAKIKLDEAEMWLEHAMQTSAAFRGPTESAVKDGPAGTERFA